jgi:hypothetical protein
MASGRPGAISDRTACRSPPTVVVSQVCIREYHIKDVLARLPGVGDVIVTIFVAILLVVGVVFLFLQNWRATIIPVIAIPVSLVGTFTILAAFGISLNNLSLFGLVLAVGIVVVDAIVVVWPASVGRRASLDLAPPIGCQFRSCSYSPESCQACSLLRTVDIDRSDAQTHW